MSVPLAAPVVHEDRQGTVAVPGPRPSVEAVDGRGPAPAADDAEDREVGYPGVRYALRHCTALRHSG